MATPSIQRSQPSSPTKQPEFENLPLKLSGNILKNLTINFINFGKKSLSPTILPTRVKSATQNNKIHPKVAENPRSENPKSGEKEGEILEPLSEDEKVPETQDAVEIVPETQLISKVPSTSKATYAGITKGTAANNQKFGKIDKSGEIPKAVFTVSDCEQASASLKLALVGKFSYGLSSQASSSHSSSRTAFYPGSRGGKDLKDDGIGVADYRK